MLPVVYEEFPTIDKSEWRNREAPTRHKWFDEELKIIGGRDVSGKDRLRRVWGGNAEWYFEAELGDKIPSGWYKKYFLCFTKPVIKGWKYERDGKTHILPPNFKVAPANAVLTKIQERGSVGMPRWIVEYLCEDGEYRHLATMENLKKGKDRDGNDCVISYYVEPAQAQSDYIAQLFESQRRSVREKIDEVMGDMEERKRAAEALTEERIQRRTEEIYRDLRNEKVSFEDLQNLPMIKNFRPLIK